MKINTKAVASDAIRKNNIYRYSDAWWQKALSFDHSLRLSEYCAKLVRGIFEELGIQARKENLQNFQTLLANLFYVRKNKPIRVSLSPNRWKQTRYTVAGASTINIIKQLEELGYLKMKIGYNNKLNKIKSRDTRITPTELLLQHIPKIDVAITKKPVELIELRNEKEKLIPYKDNPFTIKLREKLELINHINEQFDIRFKNEKIYTYLVAIFKNNFDLYGRLHTKGYRHYQGFAESDRAEIIIDGDRVVELDYSGLHPNLLYALEGCQLLGDPYSVVDERPEARPFLKLILLAMLNAKDFTSAEQAANNWLYEKHNQRELLKPLGITRARPLMEKFIEAHAKIAHHFCNGKETGLRVMNLDSKIALDVLTHFTENGIPILAIHDSFIVQNQYKALLKKVMKQKYSKHANEFRITVK